MKHDTYDLIVGIIIMLLSLIPLHFQIHWLWSAQVVGGMIIAAGVVRGFYNKLKRKLGR